MRKNSIILLGTISVILIGFQNCSEGVKFQEKLELTSNDTADAGINGQGVDTSGDQLDTVCNPLNPSESCVDTGGPGDDGELSSGLKGNLFYLTPELHNPLFNNDLRTAKIDDYRIYGVRVPVNIIMTTVNVPTKSWEAGFLLPNGQQVEKGNNEKLFEWFHLDLGGLISLPAGSYQFATISDDGMRVTMDGSVIINNDSTHAPTYDCSDSTTTFTADDKKPLRVQYFQGPRTQISMQLLVRPAYKKDLDCDETGQWETLGPEVFFHE